MLLMHACYMQAATARKGWDPLTNTATHFLTVRLVLYVY